MICDILCERDLLHSIVSVVCVTEGGCSGYLTMSAEFLDKGGSYCGFYELLARQSIYRGPLESRSGATGISPQPDLCYVH